MTVMQGRIAAVVLAVLATWPATGARAGMKALEQAYELPLGTVTLPGSEAGQLVVRRCAGCTPEILRVTTATRYFVRPDRTAVSLRDARMAAVRAAANASALLYVYYEPATRQVRRVVLDLGSVPARAAP